MINAGNEGNLTQCPPDRLIQLRKYSV